MNKQTIVEQILDIVINEVICLQKTKNIRKSVRNCWEEIYTYEKMIKDRKNKIKELESTLYKTCNHHWERDWEDNYSRYKICNKCKLANMPYVYR
tara:strand:- start:72 stop:356 length:285 start_codon:yes stop_codon:yes gene_type:complete